MTEKITTIQESNTTEKLKNFFNSDNTKMMLIMVATATVSAVITRDVVLRNAFTFHQMNVILGDEYLRKALMEDLQK